MGHRDIKNTERYTALKVERFREDSVVSEWRQLDMIRPPEDSGVYGFRLGEQWLYVGKVKNIRKRLLDPRHRDFQIASEMERVMVKMYMSQSTLKCH